MTTKFVQMVYDHMGEYKKNTLGIEECGKYNENEYEHILPEKHKLKNLIFQDDETMRSQWENDIDKNVLHEGFSHLNSSQAMCFNFFYPLAKNYLLKHIVHCVNNKISKKELNEEMCYKFEYESELEKQQPEWKQEYKNPSNIDFMIQTSKRKIYFEIKYTEQDFGRTELDDIHREKIEKIYLPLAEKTVNFPYDFPEDKFVFIANNYQLIRNIVHSTEEDIVVFLVPKLNTSVYENAKLARDEWAKYKSHVVVLGWDDAVDCIMKDKEIKDEKIKEYYRKFKEKYFISTL